MLLKQMNKTISFLFVYVFHFVFLSEAEGQGGVADSSSYLQSSIENTIALYRGSVGRNAPLYKGKIYVGYSNKIVGHQFFEFDSKSEGTILYDGILYEDVPLCFDLSREEVVVDLENGFKIKLNHDKIGKFSLFGHTFIPIKTGELNNSRISPGMFDLLWEGETLVVAKRTKKLTNHIENNVSVSKFEQENKYFIKKNNSFYRVKSKRSVLKLFKDKKKDIRKLLKNNQIKYSRDPERGIIKIVEFSEQLSN